VAAFAITSAAMRRHLLFLALASCSSPAPVAKPTPHPTAVNPTPTPPPPPTTTADGKSIARVTLAEVGLEAASLDRTVDPCIDFYAFACGGWLQATQIPADRARWARFTEIEEKNTLALRQLLDEAATTPGDKLGDYYGACMDDAGREKRGTAAIAPVLAKIAAVKDAKSWLAAVEALHEVGAWVVWSVDGRADLKESTQNITFIDAGRLGLPDRDYYLKPDFAPKRDAYLAHVGRMLALVGAPTDRAADVVAIETELAGLTKTAIERRDPVAAYNVADAKALAKQVGTIDWPGYWKALGISPSKKLIIGTPRYIGALDKLRAKFTFEQWRTLFRYRFVKSQAFALPKAFDDEAFELEKALTGVEKQRDRDKRCVEATERALGELLGQRYVAKHFPPAARVTATALVDAIATAMGGEIGQLDWMSAATKSTAQAKLAKIVRMVGYPDAWRTYEFDVKRDDFGGDQLRADAFETHRRLARAGKPVDRAEWQMAAYEVNAYYQPPANNTALPAGILQPPFFGADRAVAANLGGIGMVIGHELTHGFDDQGAKYDADGNLHDWWQAEDKTKFETKGACVADQYETFEAAPKQFVQGRLVLGESIADLGGVKVAFQAYRALRRGADKAVEADGFTEDQQFFLAVGQAWCDKDRPAEVQRRLTVDPHAPPKFRVFGALRNLREFASAFSCAAGTPMNPSNVCSVW